MEVEAGNENMKFETGPFSFYGVMALNASSLGECTTFSRPTEVEVPGPVHITPPVLLSFSGVLQVVFVVIFPSTSSSTLQALILLMFDLIGWLLKLLLSGLKCVLSGFIADEYQKLVTCFCF